jgi:hypothetical protein
MFLGFAKQTKNNQNRLSFGLFRFELKKKFDCFEDTLDGMKYSKRGDEGKI